MVNIRVMLENPAYFLTSTSLVNHYPCKVGVNIRLFISENYSYCQTQPSNKHFFIKYKGDLHHFYTSKCVSRSPGVLLHM